MNVISKIRSKILHIKTDRNAKTDVDKAAT